MGVFQNNLMGAAAAAASASTDFYSHQIDTSLRNSAAQDGTLKWTAGTPTSRDTFTLSYWVKRYTDDTDGAANNVFVAGTGGGTYFIIGFSSNDFWVEGAGGNYSNSWLITDRKARDISAWYHVVYRFDSTQSSTSNRFRLYVNGEQETSFSNYSIQSDIAQNEDWSFINESGVVQAFGGLSGKGHGTEGADLQMAEIVFCDGQSYGPDSFGETKNGVWIPKDPSGLTFGNNGYYLKFESSSDLGNDSSGNNNDFTANNLSAHDQLLDSPTFGSSNGGNYCTLNPLNTGSNNTLSEGNLKVTNSSGGCTIMGTMSLVTGYKWYFEARCTGSGNNWIGIIEENDYTDSANTNSSIAGSGSYNTYLYAHSGDIYYGSSSASLGASFTTGDVIGVLVDLESSTNTISFYKDGAAQGSAFDLTGTGINYTAMSDRGSGSGDGFIYNFGQDSSFAGAETAASNTDSSGRGEFLYDESTGGLALCAANLPTAEEVDPAQTDDDYPQELFFMSQYTGNLTGRTITTENQPDLIFNRQYNYGQNWYVVDSTRVITDNKYILTNETDAEATLPQANFTSVGATSVGISSGTWLNSTGSYYQMWMWRANGGTTSTNTQGDIDSTVQVDPSGCFSIVKYTGGLSSSGVETVGHGLSKAPSLFITKSLEKVGNWWLLSDGQTSWNYGMNLNSNGASTDKSGNGSMSAPTSTVFSTNYTDGLNENGNDFIAYCFANCEGYIKSGSYIANGDADGAFVYTGFKPAMIIVKGVVSGSGWVLEDNKLSPFNPSAGVLEPNQSDALYTTANPNADLLSNGFKVRTTNAVMGSTSYDPYIYLAFAHNPFQYATAR